MSRQTRTTLCTEDNIGSHGACVHIAFVTEEECASQNGIVRYFNQLQETDGSPTAERDIRQHRRPIDETDSVRMQRKIYDRARKEQERRQTQAPKQVASIGIHSEARRN